MKRLTLFTLAAIAVPVMVGANSAAAHGVHLGAIFWAEEYCEGRPSVIADDLHMSYSDKSNPDKPDFESGASNGYKVIGQLAAEVGIANTCAEIARRYGPNGVVHPKLWVGN